jgi:chromosome segregation protein
VTAATIVAVVAACIGLLALVASVLVLRKVRAHQQLLEREIERGKGAFDEVVAREAQTRAVELEQTLARQRADSLSQLAEEERKIADERRRDVLERERDAGARLGEQLTEVQRSVEQRLTDWASDVEQLQEGLHEELRRIEARQRQLMTETEAKLGTAAEGVQGQVDEQRQLLARLRTELAGSAQQLMQAANAELEQHAAERRRALHEVADRLRKRERDLHEIAEREGNDAAQRIQIAIGDVERRQVEQLQRIVNRETLRYAEAATQQFDSQIKTAREEAARRLSRELDLAVERFSREAEGVLTERLNHVSDAAASRVEERLARLRAGLERQRDDALQSLEDRAHQVEAGLRERLNEIATDAESERAILDARLHDLARRLDELATRA